MPIYSEEDKQSFRQKEKREMFRTIINSFIMKSGGELDIDWVLGIAEKITDKAWSLYPDKNGEEKPL